MSELVDCRVCGRNVFLNVDGRIRLHRVSPDRKSKHCLGSSIYIPEDERGPMKYEMPGWLGNQRLYKKTDLSQDSQTGEPYVTLNPEDEVFKLEDANVISSECRLEPKEFFQGEHKLFIDLDVEHYYVPSTTPGHGHLYINVDLNRGQLRTVLDVLERFGVVSKGWTRQVSGRKANTFRLPWIKKEAK